MPTPSINIFMMSPVGDGDNSKNDKKRKKKSALADALREKKDEGRHEESMNKLSSMIRELQILPHAEHAGGG